MNMEGLWAHSVGAVGQSKTASELQTVMCRKLALSARLHVWTLTFKQDQQLSKRSIFEQAVDVATWPVMIVLQYTESCEVWSSVTDWLIVENHLSCMTFKEKKRFCAKVYCPSGWVASFTAAGSVQPVRHGTDTSREGHLWIYMYCHKWRGQSPKSCFKIYGRVYLKLIWWVLGADWLTELIVNNFVIQKKRKLICYFGSDEIGPLSQ